ncbi:MAG: glutamine--fructose-6-phosphate transaminase (isomerizing) [Bacteriovoracaceae bacterium]|nr:glutamine--fructose-6-phosphate transaminase (isomerizing) [Bacteriovoracaceae bacterium]
MCGIMGHIGPDNSIDVVLEGLKRLEYRGYDSAGICFKNPKGQLSLHKKKGALDNLKATLHNKNYISHSCIGHTRWATHGKVNDVNAHPHLSDSIAIDHDNSIAIVHNGIIENASELRVEMQNKGYKFNTDTDSEVFLALLEDLLNRGEKFKDAVVKGFKRIEGNSAFVMQMKGNEKILAIKKGAPLVCGKNLETSEVFVSSDPYALAGFVDSIYFPDDDVLCSLSPLINKEVNASELSGLSFFELDGTNSKRFKMKQQEMKVEVSQKGHFEHYMLKEIHEQPNLIRSLGQYYYKGDGKKLLEKVIEGGELPSRIQITACGTAWHAGLVVRDFIEKFAKIPCNVELASEFRYRQPILYETDLAIFISQSGETADTLAAQALCKENGVRTLSIVNVEESSLYRACDKNILIRAGVEIGVASTKAFTQMALSGRLLAEVLRREHQSGYEGKREYELFNLLAERIELLLSDTSHIEHIAQEIYMHKGFIFTGRGKDFPIALEGALKLKEIAYVHAEGYASGELKHGPIALIDEQMVNIAIVSFDLYNKTFSNIQEVMARHGIIVAIGPQDDKKLQEVSEYFIPLNFEGLEELTPIYVNVATQLLAYNMAKFKGTDIDKPRNLAKSVTVE